MDIVHECHNHVFLLATVATPINSGHVLSANAHNLAEYYVVNRFMRAAAALRCRAWVLLYGALVTVNFSW